MKTQYNILVVEDDDAAWSVLEFILKAATFQVERANGGRTALDLVHKRKFDAILLDLMLPEMTGEDFLKQLNSDPQFKDYPILVNSTSAEMQSVKNQIKACSNLKIEMLPRPADPADIQQGLRRLLGLSEDLPQDIKMPNREVRKKVLIVDDDSAVRAMYVPYFTAKGYDAIAASNGKEALRALQNENVDLMILDLNMPEMTGEEVMKAMLENPKWKAIPIIIDTAISPAEPRLAKIKSTFIDRLRFEFFQRPTSLSELTEAIDRILIS